MLSLQLREPGMTMRQRVIDHLALGCRLPFRATVEQPGLEQVHRHACATLRDFARDSVFPFECQCHRCAKRVRHLLYETSMLNASVCSNLFP